MGWFSSHKSQCPYVLTVDCHRLHSDLDKKFSEVDKRMDRQDTMMWWQMGVGVTTLLAVIGGLAALLGSYIQAGG